MSDAIQQAIDALKQAEAHCRDQHLYLMGNMHHNAIRALQALQHSGQVGIYSSACQQDYVEWTDEDDKKYRIRHATPHSVVPKGYVLVPVEPTEAMLSAFMGRAVKYGWELEVDSPRDGYKAMLSAVKKGGES